MFVARFGAGAIMEQGRRGVDCSPRVFACVWFSGKRKSHHIGTKPPRKGWAVHEGGADLVAWGQYWYEHLQRMAPVSQLLRADQPALGTSSILSSIA
jgi:hypothetical protein